MALLLLRTSNTSRIQQETQASDLTYFMSAEWWAATHDDGRSTTTGSPERVLSNLTMSGVESMDMSRQLDNGVQLPPHHNSTFPSWMLQPQKAVLREIPTATERRAGQQRFFRLRRRLAYRFADQINPSSTLGPHCASSSTVAEDVEDDLQWPCRRAALSLRFARDLLLTARLCHRPSHDDYADSIRAISNDEDEGVQAPMASSYFSQMVVGALLSEEVVDLILWCGRDVEACATSLTQAVQHRTRYCQPQKPYKEERGDMPGVLWTSASTRLSTSITEDRFSKKWRTLEAAPEHTDLLDTATALVELVGDLSFCTVELVLSLTGGLDGFISHEGEEKLRCAMYEITSVVCAALRGVADLVFPGHLHFLAMEAGRTAKVHLCKGSDEHSSIASATAGCDAARALQQRLSFSSCTIHRLITSQRDSWANALLMSSVVSKWHWRLEEEVCRAAGHRITDPSASVEAAPTTGGAHGGDTGLCNLHSDALMVLLYILAQHGRVTEVVQLTGGEAATQQSNVTAELLCQLALANAEVTTPEERTKALVGLIHLGVVPQRPLAVTEYARVLRCLLNTGQRDGVKPAPTVSQLSGVGWLLSPAQVWRYSAGYPYRLRVALCLTGFQVAVRNALVDALSMEDLYVVLTVTRQSIARRQAALQARQNQRSGRGMDVEEEAAFVQRRWQWGVAAPPMGFTAALAETTRMLLSSSSSHSGHDDDSADTVESLNDPLPLHLLPAHRCTAPYSVAHVRSLCAAYQSTRLKLLRDRLPAHPASVDHHLNHPDEAAHPNSSSSLLRPRPQQQQLSPSLVGSAVLLSLASKGMRQVLRAVRYEEEIHLYWDTALMTVAAHLSGRFGAAVPMEAEVEATIGEVAEALARKAETSSSAEMASQLIHLAPYLSSYAVGRLVQRPLIRLLTWKQCLTLLPYTPLGSRSQHLLLRRVAQDGEGRRAVQTISRDSPRTMGVTSLTLSSAVALSGGSCGDRKRQEGSLNNCADHTLLSLLLECHWCRALGLFEQAPPRVQVAGAPHMIRLLVEADVWRSMADAQLRPLIRLAVRSSSHSTPDGGGRLLEEVMETALHHGWWQTGLYFHQCIREEQPELLRQSRRAQRYASMLCRGLLERTSLAKAVAELTRAARRSQWARATSFFLQYATRRESTSETDGSPLDSGGVSGHASRLMSLEVKDDAEPSIQELQHMASCLPPVSQDTTGVGSTIVPRPTLADTFHLIQSSWSFRTHLPPELSHVAHTVRYAMMHTPGLWQFALRWIPIAALPLAHAHEQAFLARRPTLAEDLHAALPSEASQWLLAASSFSTRLPLALATPPPSSSLLSAVADARRQHRPQRPNSVFRATQEGVASVLRNLRHAGAWVEAMTVYEKAMACNCMPYAAASLVLDAALQGGAPWEVTIGQFMHMSQRMRPDVHATAVALQACAEGSQWQLAFQVLKQSLLTQHTPAPRLVDLAVSTALHCGVWSRALEAAHQYRRTRDPYLAHTVLLTYTTTGHWDDAVDSFYCSLMRGLRPLDVSLELAIEASEAASAEYRKAALMVGTIASALEDLYDLSGAVLEHIVFVQRRARCSRAAAVTLHGKEGTVMTQYIISMDSTPS